VPIDLDELVAPGHTAVVTCELQRGIVGDLATMAELADEVARRQVVPAARRLVVAARAAGVPVVHATIELRADRAGASINNPLMAVMARHPDQVRQGTPAADVVPELGPEPGDVVCRRIHGLTPFTGTELDAILRNLGATTIVPVGVSVNAALLGLCLVGADLGYRIALPLDAIAGHPAAYADDVVRHTLALIANTTTTAELRRAWAPAPTG
jgi:nicotinamidase-related amidase